jgi:hypothetical protein
MSMRRRGIPVAAMAVTVIASVGVIAGPVAAAPHEVVVGPGDNVQVALSAAVPGTTVKLEAGTYHQFLVMPEGVTLEGSGTGAVGGTVLAWPRSGANPCWNGFNALVCMASYDRVRDLRVDTTAAPQLGNFGIGTVASSTGTTVEDVVAVANLAADVVPANDGIFLAGANAAIRGTQTSGFHEGILLTAVGGQVEGNFGQGNCSGIVVFDFGLAGFFGPLGQASNVTVVGNREQDPRASCGFYGGAGIFLLGAPRSSVRDNVISGFNSAAIITDSAYDTIDDNAVRDTCLGVDVLNDGLPAPDGPADHDVVRGNEVTGDPAQGCYSLPGLTFATGIRFDGPTNATAAGNEVHVSLPSKSAAAGPVDGIFVNSQATIFNAHTPPPQNVTVTGNEVHEALNGSTGYDIAWDGTGTGISFVGNECGTSNPAGLCAGD